MIKERHGVKLEKGHITLSETGGKIMHIMSNGTTSMAVEVSPEEARYLASKLRRMASRAERNISA